MRSTRKRVVRYFVRLAVAALLIGLLVLVLIPQLGVVWHLLKGNTVEFRGVAIPVPKGFFVVTRTPDLRMWRLSLGNPLLDRPRGMISVLPLEAAQQNQKVLEFQQDRVQFESEARRIASRDGLELLGVLPSEASGQAGVCLVLGRSKEQHRVVRCAFRNTLVAYRYDGDSAFVPDFFSIIKVARDGM